jgi:hypothetical protein
MLICKTWVPLKRAFDPASAELHYLLGSASGSSAIDRCTLAVQPGVAIRGRASLVVDAIGLTCDEPLG